MLKHVEHKFHLSVSVASSLICAETITSSRPVRRPSGGVTVRPVFLQSTYCSSPLWTPLQG